jgi:hypothetical protein
MPDDHPRCDVCGQPATSRAFDTIEDHGPDNHGFVSISPVGWPRYGCDKHPVQSEAYYSNPSLLAR